MIEEIIDYAFQQASFLDICLLGWIWREYRLNGNLLDRMFSESKNSTKICTMLDELVARGRNNGA